MQLQYHDIEATERTMNNSGLAETTLTTVASMRKPMFKATATAFKNATTRATSLSTTRATSLPTTEAAAPTTAIYVSTTPRTA